MKNHMELKQIGIVRSSLTNRWTAPKQGCEGAPAAQVVMDPAYGEALQGLRQGSRVLLFTWLHEADRDTLLVHPRGDESRAMRGVFSTRSPDRPNPIGLHDVTITDIQGLVLTVEPLEAIDGTPVIDIKSM